MTKETIRHAASEYAVALECANERFTALNLDTTPEALNAGAATILIHATKIHAMGGATNGHLEGPALAKAVEDVFADITCGKCGGDVYDNTAPGAKKNPKGPDYKCKTCGAAAWINKDKTITWKA